VLDRRGEIGIGEQGEAAGRFGHAAPDGVALAAILLVDEHASGDRRTLDDLPSKLRGGVGAAVIHDDDFSRPRLLAEVLRHAIKRRAQALLLIVCRDDDGQLDRLRLSHDGALFPPRAVAA